MERSANSCLYLEPWIRAQGAVEGLNPFPPASHSHSRSRSRRARFLDALRLLAVKHYLTCEQLLEILELLPPPPESDGAAAVSATSLDRIEVVTMFWARTIDRQYGWTDVMRKLDKEGQVSIAQRLGGMGDLPQGCGMHSFPAMGSNLP